MTSVKLEVTKIVLAKIPVVTKKNKKIINWFSSITLGTTLYFQAFYKEIMPKHSSKQTTSYFTYFLVFEEMKELGFLSSSAF